VQGTKHSALRQQANLSCHQSTADLSPNRALFTTRIFF